jgi:hypothetical protein
VVGGLRTSCLTETDDMVADAHWRTLSLAGGTPWVLIKSDGRKLAMCGTASQSRSPGGAWTRLAARSGGGAAGAMGNTRGGGGSRPGTTGGAQVPSWMSSKMRMRFGKDAWRS